MVQSKQAGTDAMQPRLACFDPIMVQSKHGSDAVGQLAAHVFRSDHGAIKTYRPASVLTLSTLLCFDPIMVQSKRVTFRSPAQLSRRFRSDHGAIKTR